MKKNIVWDWSNPPPPFTPKEDAQLQAFVKLLNKLQPDVVIQFVRKKQRDSEEQAFEE